MSCCLNTRSRLILLLVLIGVAKQGPADDSASVPIQFNRHIRPILSEKCLQCHGPDKHARQAELRLDDPQSVGRDRGGYHVIVVGKPEASELYRRISSSDAAERMPPSDSGKQLTDQEVQLFRRWIEQGGAYQRHWSLILPKRPRKPQVAASDWPRNAVDHYVLARLESEGLRPASAADRATLLRRASLDLTGLPPSLEDLDRFLADASADAFERAVDRLLASPRYGEHRARYWLDAARYADTSGFFTDDERFMWQWRDWVIRAFNANMPFDQFTIEQLAGDLLPNPSLDQRIATGFNRNHMTTRESGVIDEEYRVEYVVDRVETTSTVWLGLTLGCARCHDHKFDPISQKEFYRFFAFFNSVPETGNSRRAGNAAPFLEVPTATFNEDLRKLRSDVALANKRLAQIDPELAQAQQEWQKDLLTELPPPPTRGLAARYEMERHGQDTSGCGRHTQAIGSVKFATGMVGLAAEFDGDAILELDSSPDFERTDAFSYGAWIKPTSGGPACVLSKNDDVNSLRGFDLMLRKGRAVVHLVHRFSSNAIQVMSATAIRSRQWQHVMVTYDGSGSAAGVSIFFNGKPQPVEIRHDSLTATIQTTEPLRIGRRSTSAAFVGLIDDVRIYDRQLAANEVYRLATSPVIRSILETPKPQQSQSQQTWLRDHYLAHAAPTRIRQTVERVAELQKKLQQLQTSIPTTMVMQDEAKPRDTFFLMRGQYDQRGDKVLPGVPASLVTYPRQMPANRLGLSRWLVGPGNPLTARVTVNRFWQQIFGTGIVKTVEDFGSQGEWPSHLDLLDWMAVEFRESGWNVKHILRLIVTSATYRQSSSTSMAPSEPYATGSAVQGSSPSPANLWSTDPGNRLFARGPRFRLDAEVVRDNALAISGLLVERPGGPSVKPYQPPGLWKAVSYDGNLTYPQDHGAALYRRGLYTYWKRQSPPPGMLALDAPTRETCTVRRPRTNTPLQALALMNDTTFVEAARALAARMMEDAGPSPASRVRYAFRRATARIPDKNEVAILLDVYVQQLALYRTEESAAHRLLAVGESPRNATLDPAEQAAWTIVASTILNMDETVTKH